MFPFSAGIVGPQTLYLGHLADLRSWSEGGREWHRLSLVDLREDTAGSLVGIAFCFPSWEWLPSL